MVLQLPEVKVRQNSVRNQIDINRGIAFGFLTVLLAGFSGCSDSHKEATDNVASLTVTGSVKTQPGRDSCCYSFFLKANDFFNRNETDSAATFFLQSADHYIHIHNWPCAVKSLYLAGETMVFQDPAKAEITLQRAMDLATQYMPLRHDCRLYIGLRLGYLYLLTGYPDKSLNSFIRANQLLDSVLINSIEIPSYIAFSIGDLYRFYFQNPEEAEKYFRKALVLLKNDTVPHDYYLSKAYYCLGTVSYMMEDYNQSQAFIDKAIDHLENLPPGDRSLLESCYSVLGELEYRRENFGKSEQNLLLALNFNQQYNNYKSDLVIIYNLLGEILAAKGDYDKAWDYLETAKNHSLDSLPVSRQNFAVSLVKQAGIMRVKDEPENALTYLDQAHEIMLSHPEPIIVSDVHRLRGEIMESSGQCTAALRSYSASIWADCFAMNDSVAYLPPASTVINANRTAEIAALAGNAFFRRFMNSGKRNQADLDSSVVCYLFADTLMIISRTEMVDRESKLDFLEKSRKVYDNALTAVWHLPEDKSSLRNSLAFYFTERNKSVIMQETLKRSEMLNERKVTREMDRADRDLRLQLSYARKALGEEQHKTLPDEDRRAYYKNRITALSLLLDSMDQQYHEKFPSFFSFFHTGKNASLDQLRKRLNRNDLLIEYFWGYTDVYAVYLNRKRAGFIRLGSADSMRRAVTAFHAMISSVDSLYLYTRETMPYQKAAIKAFNMLLSPILMNAGEEPDHVVIIPDGPVADIPFEAMIGNENSPVPDFFGLPYLVTRYGFTYHFSLNLWASPGKSRKKTSRATRLVLFSPGLDGAMPAQSIEEQVTCDLFDTRLVKGEKATPLAFLEEAPRADIIHLTVHGQMIEKDQYQVALLMHGDSLNRQGFLTMDIITALRLRAWLAVLAACNAGSGTYLYGDGIQSISRAFMAAGCGAVIVSPDRITETVVDRIITEFYRNVTGGRNLSLALAMAKRKYLAGSDNILSHPAYWSNIRLWGNSENFLVKWRLPVLISVFLIMCITFSLLIRNRQANHRSQ